jgi:MoxR-like ATPase
MKDLRERIQTEVGKVVIGQRGVVDALLAASLVGGHVLLEGVPGTAKTLLATAYARATGLQFGRAQFTPDMLPSDLTGTVTLVDGGLRFRPGPIFTNVLLADEINRTPPKTQAALLEAMGEGQVTADGTSHPLPEPFLVVATQNPIEYEGTYPLPEAQLDRFLMKVAVDYPSEASEMEMLRQARDGVKPIALADVQTVTGPEELAAARATVSSVRIEEPVLEYLTRLVRATRSVPAVEVGASPRAAVHLLAAARAIAALAGRDFVTPDDIGLVALPVLRHRIVLRPEAELERYLADDAVRAAMMTVEVPR